MVREGSFRIRFRTRSPVVEPFPRMLARLLYANCCEHPPEGPLELLEIGSGTGLFARLFLEEFVRLCETNGREFHRQVLYLATDRSRRTVEQWAELELFAGMPVEAGIADALHPLELEIGGASRNLSGLRAVFCNYSLDSLPATVLRKGENGPEELCIRTHLTADSAKITQRTRLTLPEIRGLAESLDPQLIPLVPLFEFEASFQPCRSSYPYETEALAYGQDSPRTILNYGAIQCLEKVIPGLAPLGFVLINDYGPVRAEDTPSMSGSQKVRLLRGAGIELPFLEHHFSSHGVAVLRPESDERLPDSSAPLHRAPIPQTRRASAIF